MVDVAGDSARSIDGMIQGKWNAGSCSDCHKMRTPVHIGNPELVRL